jgi:hypothetical protein
MSLFFLPCFYGASQFNNIRIFYTLENRLDLALLIQDVFFDKRFVMVSSCGEVCRI